ncbi:unnamed protein product [Cuscuta epithymum]|uniref:Uncharacterized protein n=1 Tax=Cuscuta epithymum TaxID=186058 RepID=A0AAV0EHG0_9ASTE|nr:unnamed protein product [Cuscuta epithymum]
MASLAEAAGESGEREVEVLVRFPGDGVVGQGGEIGFVGGGGGTGAVARGGEEKVRDGEGGAGVVRAAGGVAGCGGQAVVGGGGGGGEEESAEHGAARSEVKGEELALVEELVGGA